MICLSFDTDHMSSARMSEFVKEFMIPGSATFFCTQRYDLLLDMDHEIAPHPYLVEGGDWDNELQSKRAEFPLAKGWRSHSCVFSHLLAKWVAENNYVYVSCHDEFGNDNVQPIQHAWGCWHLPIYYMDTLDFSYNHNLLGPDHIIFDQAIIQRAINGNGIYVFDFHPIHLMLNTPRTSHYFSMRERFKNGEPIDRLRYGGYGTASFFHDVLVAMTANNMVSKSMSEALQEYTFLGVNL